MDYATISKKIIEALYRSYESLKESPLDQSLRALIELRVSQINGCAYCCSLHTKEAQKLAVADDKIKRVNLWRDSELFSGAEKAALAWAEVVTNLDGDRDETRHSLASHFVEREVVDITAAIALMNAFNRMAISLKD